jgi:uncharacterized protein (UPF0332 family)
MTTYLDRALEAARSAREMRESADYNGACNRAYYSVFYAASGLLEGVGDERPGKTHASLLRRFSERFVLSGEAPSQLGRALGVAHDLRSKADYSLAGASKEDADDAIAAMERVLEFARARLGPGLKEGSHERG